MITEDYVSLEVSKLLKEKRFNEPCRLYYDKYHGYVPVFVEDSKLTEYGYKELVRNDQNSISDFIASAPSLYVAMKWLREEKQTSIIIEFDVTKRGYCPYVYQLDYDMDWVVKWRKNIPMKYEEAVEEALKYALENLI